MSDDNEEIYDYLNTDNQDQDPNYLLLKATEQNDIDRLTQLISQGVSPNFTFVKYNAKETTPLTEAIARGHEEMIQLIITTDPKTIDASSLYTALTAKDGNFNRQTVQLLLSCGATISIELIDKVKDIECLQYSAIHAINTNRIDHLKRLLDAGVSLDFQITDYLDLMTSPLDRTISLNKPKIAHFLLKEAKVNPNQPINGFSPLLQAIDHKKFELVSVLLKFGAIFYEHAG
ncbi:ankyrin repeat domain-containing protein [Thiotrichales bacterium 19S3-7]|nr:ankyrin repeat domain-containing protein [Thiotrichales bacterium 19S3-7]MCF6800595.1 ankyrin repeat domain-containing protein [Thiotrichales bacterium 19S3-11]